MRLLINPYTFPTTSLHPSTYINSSILGLSSVALSSLVALAIVLVLVLLHSPLASRLLPLASCLCYIVCCLLIRFVCVSFIFHLLFILFSFCCPASSLATCCVLGLWHSCQLRRLYKFILLTFLLGLSVCVCECVCLQLFKCLCVYLVECNINKTSIKIC